MAVEKVTPMILKCDLQCPCCYKKIKKTLCKFPQIRDQIYNEKTNTVAITVVCCSPERIRDKLCSRGGRAIKSIEIIEPEKKKEPEKKPPQAEKPKEAIVIPKPAAEKPKEAAKPKPAAEKPKEKPKEAEKPKADAPAAKPKEAPKADPPKAEPAAAKPPQPQQPPQAAPAQPKPVPVNGVPSVFPYIGPTYDGYNAGPYYHGYGFSQPPPQPCYEGYYGHTHGPHGCGHGHGHGHAYGYGGVTHVNKCDSYFSEENPQGCTIM